MKTVTIHVVIEGLGMIKKGTEEHLEWWIPGSTNLAEVALTGTAHILKKNLNYVKKIKQWTNEAMLNVFVLNNNRLITHQIYIYTLYLLYLYYLFTFLFFYSIYSCL